MPTIKHKIVGTVSFENLGDGRLRLLNGWENENIVTVTIPQLAGVDVGGGKRSSGKVRWFKGGVYQLRKAFEEVEAAGLDGRILTYAGSFVPRMIRGSVRTPSEHSFGTAFDINVAWNALGVTPAAKGKTGSVVELVPIFEKWGFRWGGNFSRRDGMHFEIARLIQANDAPKISVPMPVPVTAELLKIDWNGNIYTMEQIVEKLASHKVIRITEKLDESRIYIRSEPVVK